MCRAPPLRSPRPGMVPALPTRQGRAGAGCQCIDGGHRAAHQHSLPRFRGVPDRKLRFALRSHPSTRVLAIFGIQPLMAGVSGGRVLKGLLAGLLGLALATVGLDPDDGVPALQLRPLEFLDGISFIPVMIGLFGLAEVFTQIAEGHDSRSDVDASLGRVLPTGQEWKRMAGPAIGGRLGRSWERVPAAGGDIGSVVAWEQARGRRETPKSSGRVRSKALAPPSLRRTPPSAAR
ncbi:MAG: tripartite tricarboxylate transporter permease [Bryobacterales bacterium]